MPSFDIFPFSALSTNSLTVIANTSTYSDAYTPTPNSKGLGLFVNVTTAGAGKATLTLQTAVAGASSADGSSWLDMEETTISGVSLGTLGASLRLRSSGSLLDKVRLKVTGDSTATAVLQVAFHSDKSLTLAE